MFGGALGKGSLPKTPSLLLDSTGQDSLTETQENACPEDPAHTSSRDAANTLAPDNNARALADQELPASEPTLRDIFAAITSCNVSITTLITEIKRVKLELNLVRQDMQKLRDRTAALEDRVSNVEDVIPLQREVRHMQIDYHRPV